MAKKEPRHSSHHPHGSHRHYPMKAEVQKNWGDDPRATDILNQASLVASRSPGGLEGLDKEARMVGMASRITPKP